MEIRTFARIGVLSLGAALALAACTDAVTVPRSASSRSGVLGDTVVDGDPGGTVGPANAQSCTNPPITVRRRFSGNYVTTMNANQTVSVTAGQTYVFVGPAGCGLGAWKADTSVMRVNNLGDSAVIQPHRYNPNKTVVELSYSSNGSTLKSSLYVSPPSLSLSGNDRVVVGGTSTLSLQATDNASEPIPRHHGPHVLP